MADRKIELPESVPPLTQYYFYLTGGCNLACQHCWIQPSFQPNGGTGGHLDYDLFSLAIEEGLPLGLRSVKFTGGEPLLHPDLTKMMNLLRDEDLSLILETNGTLITPSLASFFKDKSTLQFVSVSLDGASADSHDAFRGVRGSFAKACAGIASLVNVGYRPQIIMSLHLGNLDEIEDLVFLAEKLGAGSVKFNLIQPSGRGMTMVERGKTPVIEKMIQLGDWVENDLQKKVSIDLFYHWPMAFHNLKGLLNNSGTCSIFNILGILPTGQLAMCGIGRQVSELCYGQLGIERVADVWSSSEVLLQMRQSIPKELQGVCQDCIFRDECLATCLAQNYLESGTMTNSFWFCRDAMSLGLFPLSRTSSKINKK